MCKELYTITSCKPASDDSPQEGFCGNSILVVGQRVVCENAAGRCVCNFGSCGSVQKIVPPIRDMVAAPRRRCPSCVSAHGAQPVHVDAVQHSPECPESGHYDADDEAEETDEDEVLVGPEALNDDRPYINPDWEFYDEEDEGFHEESE